MPLEMPPRKKKKSLESVESLKLEVDLGDEPEALRVLEGLLGEVVRAGGGDSGVLITSDRGHTRTHVYGVDAAAEQALRPLMEAAVQELTERGNPSSDTEIKLRERAGAASSLAVPVRAGGRSIGLFYLLRGSEDDAQAPAHRAALVGSGGPALLGRRGDLGP